MSTKKSAQTDTPPCRGCATWACTACGYRRSQMTLAHTIGLDTLTCDRCGAGQGRILPVRHTLDAITQEHNTRMDTFARVAVAVQTAGS